MNKKKFGQNGIKVLAVFFSISGILKLIGMHRVKKSFKEWGYPRWVRIAVGAIEVEAAALLLWRPSRSFALGQLVGLMAGAAYTHAKTPGERSHSLIPVATAALLVHMNRWSW